MKCCPLVLQMLISTGTQRMFVIAVTGIPSLEQRFSRGHTGMIIQEFCLCLVTARLEFATRVCHKLGGMRAGLEAIFAIFVATSFAAIRNRPVWFLPTVGACPVTANITQTITSLHFSQEPFSQDMQCHNISPQPSHKTW
jgi:hypothetical protein